MSTDTTGMDSDFHFGSTTATSSSGNGNGGSSVASSEVDSERVDSEVDSEVDGEAESEVDSVVDGEAESDLDVLYESFDFEMSLAQEPKVTPTPEPMLQLTSQPLYQDAPLTAYHNNLLLF